MRPLCVFDGKPLDYKDVIVDKLSWGSIPTCKSAGLDMEYLMLRGIFMPPGVKQEHVDYYVDLFKRVRETDDWKQFMEQGAYNQTFMTGDQFKQWLEKADKVHYELMKEAGFLASKT